MPKQSCNDIVRVSYDPGSSGSGIAIWSEGEWYEYTALPLMVKTIIPKPDVEGWEEQVAYTTEYIRGLLKNYDVRKFYCEMPQFFGSTAGGYAVAGSGSLVKLAYATGAVCGIFPPGIVNLVSIPEWKGQLPKDVVKKRVVDILKSLGSRKAKYSITSHGWDAVAIGLYAKGAF